MDHRCLYGHRVPAAFTFAIQSRSCPTCGAPTVTVNGYQVARKLAAEAGLDAVAAFNALRVIESEWALTPLATVPAAVPVTTGPALAPEAAPVTEEEVVVVEDVPEPAAPEPPAITAPEPPRITPRPRAEKRPEPRVEPVPVVEPPPAAARASGFGAEEEDFFKQA